MEVRDTKVDLGFSCKCDVGKAKHLMGSYFMMFNPSPNQIISSLLPLEESYDEYIARCKKKYKGNVIRDARKADKLGCSCRRFVWDAYISDISKINRSMSVRCGGVMRDSYLGEPSSLKCGIKPWSLECDQHWDIPYGIFYEGRLIAYIKLKRVKDLVLYSQILGHGKYLRQGIMYNLHFAIRRWLDPTDDKYIMYAGHFDGGKGLLLWKKKTLFEPHRIFI